MTQRTGERSVVIGLEMVRRRRFLGWCLIVVFLGSVGSLLHFDFSPASERLTDAQKKQRVYDMYADYRKSFPKVQDISATKAMALMKTAKVIFVDTRKRKEQKVSMLPGAVTEKAFGKNLAQYKDHVIIGYCTISYRSGKLSRKMQKKGVSMLNLKGGMLAWVHEGGKVYDQHGETKQVHVYSKKWNYLPDAYSPVW